MDWSPELDATIDLCGQLKPRLGELHRCADETLSYAGDRARKKVRQQRVGFAGQTLNIAIHPEDDSIDQSNATYGTGNAAVQSPDTVNAYYLLQAVEGSLIFRVTRIVHLQMDLDGIEWVANNDTGSS